MIVIGLTGSIAMGKSEVAQIFRKMGVAVFDADVEVHKLYDSEDGGNLLRPVAPQAFVSGRIDRGKLSAAVLADKSLLERLEKLVHEEIAARRKSFLQKAEIDGQNMAVVDVPLLFEKGYDKDVDVTIVVSAPQKLQHQRAMLRPGMTEEKLQMILKRQMPDSEKRRRADYIIENDGTLEDLRQRTEAVITELRNRKS